MSRVTIIILFSIFILSGKDFIEIQNFSKRNYVAYGLELNCIENLDNVVVVDGEKVGSRFKDRFKDMKSKDRYFIFTLDRKKAKIWCSVQMFKRNGRKVFSTSRIYGAEKNLKLFLKKIFKEISSSLPIASHLSLLPDIDDPYIYRKFLFAKYLLLKGNVEKAMESMEDILISNRSYKEIESLYIEHGGELSNLDITTTNSDGEAVFDHYIIKGYDSKIMDVKVVNLEHDSTLVDINVAYELRLKSGYKRKLLDEIKRNKGNTKFSGFNIYEYSADQNSNSNFFDMIKKQAIQLTVKSGDSTLYSGIKDIETYAFESGAYRDATPLFPIMPLGPANMKFKLVNKSNGLIVIKEVKKSDIDKVDSYKLAPIITE
jgi:hypothetical protein